MVENTQTELNYSPHIISKLRILVVDDHMLMRSLVSQSLEACGAKNIQLASNGLAALDLIEENLFDVVFLDWNMPEMEGIDVLKRCRTNNRYANMAIVMLTAEQTEKNVLKAIELGATSYIVKPVSKNSLTRNMNKILGWLEKRKCHAFLSQSSVTEKKPSNTPTPVKKEEPAKDDCKNCAKFEEIKRELNPIISNGVRQIFSELFDVSIIPDEKVELYSENEMVALGRLYLEDFEMVVRFVFDKALLVPLLRQMYSPEFLEDNNVYADAACEIVNILCSQIKALLYKRGFEVNMDIPEIGPQGHKLNPSESVLNVRFKLNEGDGFLIDLSATGCGSFK